MKRPIVFSQIAARSLFWAGAITLILARPTFAQPLPSPSDPRLDRKVHYTSEQASVQDIVQDLARQVGLEYNWQKSFNQTDPLCRQWVRDVVIDAKSCRDALDQILKPVGLRYELEKGAICLSRLQAAAPLAGAGSATAKFDEARKALTGPQKDTARAKALLLALVETDQAALTPNSLCYAYVYLGYIEDRAGNRQQAVTRYQQALKFAEGDPGIRECAEFGLKEPLTWIRHLDKGTPPPRRDSENAPPKS